MGLQGYFVSSGSLALFSPLGILVHPGLLGLRMSFGFFLRPRGLLGHLGLRDLLGLWGLLGFRCLLGHLGLWDLLGLWCL